jgi:hypothetical protein
MDIMQNHTCRQHCYGHAHGYTDSRSSVPEGLLIDLESDLDAKGNNLLGRGDLDSTGATVGDGRNFSTPPSSFAIDDEALSVFESTGNSFTSGPVAAAADRSQLSVFDALMSRVGEEESQNGTDYDVGLFFPAFSLF